uniref:Major facilitator superfamily (MFS) profile domain-containing protein n=1 Tax=Leersia perrieri TaxID=77586 RepID=A0A0D9WRI2_9ORYZ
MSVMEDGTERWEGYVDWRNRPAVRGRHGGMLAASFVLVVEVLENLAFLANASNLVTYLMGFMHYSPSQSATTVTNFMGTAFLLALLGGFLSDAFFTTYAIYLISAFIEFLGLVILTIQAKTPSLMPPVCTKAAGAAATTPCEPVSGAKKAMLFAGLYLTALGIGGIKGSLPSHGAEQFDEHSPRGRKGRSTFFNYFVFCLSCGALIAVTFAVWVEDNKGWQWGFGISTIAILVSIPVFVAGSKLYRNKVPTGSPLTTIAKVVLAAIFARRGGGAQSGGSNGAVIDRAPSPTGSTDMKDYCKESTGADIAASEPSGELAFLNRAVTSSWQCTVQELEDVKIVLMVLPIFFSTIMLNCCLAQLSTFSVEQAATMDTRVGGLTVPPASLPVFPVTFIILLAPVYDHVIVPFARRATGTEMGITHLQRIGTGLVLSIVAMAVAAVVEVKRKNVASNAGMLDVTTSPLPITFFWIAFQYLFLGSADLFTLAGLLEFFFSEAPARMRSLATSLSWASLALGYYLSSVLVTVVNSATGRRGQRAWLQGGNLNHYHLERFYWLMCVLSTVNYLFFLFLAIRYKYRNAGVVKG